MNRSNESKNVNPACLFCYKFIYIHPRHEFLENKAWYGYKTHYIVIVVAVDKEDYDITTSVTLTSTTTMTQLTNRICGNSSLCALFLHEVLHAGFWFLRRALISHVWYHPGTHFESHNYSSKFYVGSAVGGWLQVIWHKIIWTEAHHLCTDLNFKAAELTLCQGERELTKKYKAACKNAVKIEKEELAIFEQEGANQNKKLTGSELHTVLFFYRVERKNHRKIVGKARAK